MNQPETAPTASLKPNWSSLAKIGAITAAVGGVSLHLIGQVSHRTYLDQMGVSAGHFPKATDWLLINGYYTLAERLMVMINAFLTHTWQIVLAILALGLYMFGIERLGRWLRNKGPIFNLSGLPAWASDLLRNIFASTFLFIGAPTAIMFLTVILLVPAILGETAGKDIAAKDMRRFAEGCESGGTNTAANCVQILMDGKVLASGYIIDASQTHVAVFNPATRRTTVMEAAGKVISGKQVSVRND